MKEGNQLLISPSLFTLFVFLLLNKNWKEADYVLQDRIPRNVITNLRSLGLKVFYVRSGNSYGSSTMGRIIRILILNWEYLRFLLTFSWRYQYDEIYGNDEIIQSVPFRKFGITLIEDGSFNLQPREFFEKRVRKMHQFLLTRLFYRHKLYSYTPFGYSNYVKKIFLTHRSVIDSEINHKVESVSLKDLWSGKSEDEKHAMLSVFGINSESINALNQFKTVLLTQPLSTNEGGCMTESEKIAIYSSLLVGTSLDTLLIKTHYAEKTNYRQYFKQALVIDQPIPFQLFELLDYGPTKVITISSTPARKYRDSQCELVFAGTEIDDRIVKMYGVVRL